MPSDVEQLQTIRSQHVGQAVLCLTEPAAVLATVGELTLTTHALSGTECLTYWADPGPTGLLALSREHHTCPPTLNNCKRFAARRCRNWPSCAPAPSRATASTASK